MVVPSYEVRVPALWGAAPRIMPLAPGSTRSCSSSCSSCSERSPVASPVAAKFRSFQVPRCPGTLHTVDLSEVEEEATLAAMTVPAQSSNLKAKKSSVIFSTVNRGEMGEQKNPMRASAEMEELQRENDRLMRSLQERTAQEKELERNARMQRIIFQRREQDLRLACESAARRPTGSEAPEVSEVSKGTPGQREQLPAAVDRHLKLPIRAAKASQVAQQSASEAAVFPEASISARSSRSSVSQPNLLRGVEDEDGDVISWITPCLAEEEVKNKMVETFNSDLSMSMGGISATSSNDPFIAALKGPPQPGPQLVGSWPIGDSLVQQLEDVQPKSPHSDLSTPSRSAESTSSQAAGSTQRWIISLSKVEVETAVKAANHEQRPEEEEDGESSRLPEETPALSSELLAEMCEQEAAYDASPPVEEEDRESSCLPEETPALSSELLAEMCEQEAAYDASPPVEEEDRESSRLPEEAAAASELPAEIQQDVDGQASDSDSDEDSGSDTSESSDSSGSSTSSSSGSTDAEEEEEESESSPKENGDSLDKAQNEPSGNAREGFAPTNELDAEPDTSPIFQEREVEEVPELSATTVWRNKILGRLEAPQRMARQKGLENLTMPRHQVPAPSMSPPHPFPKRTAELSGTDALVSLRLSAKELAREKLKMLQQYRAEAKGTGVSLPQLGVKLSRVPESQVWEVSQVPQAAHFTKLGKARMSKQAAQSKGNKNNPFKASMTQSRSLPSISATPSQFCVTAGVQKQVLQARIPSEQRPMDMRT